MAPEKPLLQIVANAGVLSFGSCGLLSIETQALVALLGSPQASERYESLKLVMLTLGP